MAHSMQETKKSCKYIYNFESYPLISKVILAYHGCIDCNNYQEISLNINGFSEFVVSYRELAIYEQILLYSILLQF